MRRHFGCSADFDAGALGPFPSRSAPASSPILLIDASWRHRHGINGWTAEPRDK
jgi:hypothetical protein